MEDDNNRLFLLQNEDDSFLVGFCADGRQAVMGLLCPEVVTFFFDPEGNLLDREARSWSDAAAKLAGNDVPYQIFSDSFCQLIDQQKLQWQAELGFHAATVRIKEFFDAQYGVGIELLPDHFMDIDDDDDLDEDEREDLIQEREEWLARGSFVWWWAKDYYMSRDGEIEST